MTTGAADLSQANDTRELIIESAYACFAKHGLQKTTIVDIARAANVSRSTVYEYFSDKRAILEACAENASEEFYREMSKAMNHGDSLEDKLCRAAVFVTQASRAFASEKFFDEEALSLLLTKDAAVLLRECAEFFAPHLSAAKLTGEVRKDLDVAAAGSGLPESCSRCSARRRRRWTWTIRRWSPISCVRTWCVASPTTAPERPGAHRRCGEPEIRLDAAAPAGRSPGLPAARPAAA